MSLRIEERSSSAAIVRVCLPTDQNDDELPEGGAVALLVRPVKLRELEAEHETALRELHIKRQLQHDHTTAQMRHAQVQQMQQTHQVRQIQPQRDHLDALARAERLRAASALRDDVGKAQRRINEIKEQMIAAVCDAFELQSDERRSLPLPWMLFHRNVLLDCAVRRLAIAKSSHPRLGALAPGMDEDCARRIAEALSEVEPSLHSDLDTGSFVALDHERQDALSSGTVEAQWLTPVRGSQAVILVSSLKPNTCFEVSTPHTLASVLCKRRLSRVGM